MINTTVSEDNIRRLFAWINTFNHDGSDTEDVYIGHRHGIWEQLAKGISPGKIVGYGREKRGVDDNRLLPWSGTTSLDSCHRRAPVLSSPPSSSQVGWAVMSLGTAIPPPIPCSGSPSTTTRIPTTLRTSDYFSRCCIPQTRMPKCTIDHFFTCGINYGKFDLTPCPIN
jgi:hypothetical protein